MLINQIGNIVCALTSHFSEKYPEVLRSGFEPRERPIHVTHFIPLSFWTNDRHGHVIDAWNGDEYWSDDEWAFTGIKRIKHLGLAFGTPVFHSIGIGVNVVNRIAKIVTLAHFKHPELLNHSLTGRLRQLTEDILIIALSPILFLGLEFSAIYGLIRPYDGGKLYATFERTIYGKTGEDFFAPCFQPRPQSHLCGGEGNNAL